MVTCVHGHHNPVGWELCGECGEPLEEEAVSGWDRTKWTLVGAGAIAALVVLGSIIGYAITGGEQAAAPETATSDQAVLEWWSKARDPFADLAQSLADAQRALATADRPAMEDACQQMHDTANVELQSHLPSPSPEVTSELEAATVDAHEAAHMCLSVLSGSMNSYDGEFPVNLDQAEKHLVAAQELIRQSLMSAT